VIFCSKAEKDIKRQLIVITKRAHQLREIVNESHLILLLCCKMFYFALFSFDVLLISSTAPDWKGKWTSGSWQNLVIQKKVYIKFIIIL